MNHLLVALYDWFERHKVIFYLILTGSLLLCGAGAFRIDFEENIFKFFNAGDDANLQENVFENLKVKDKIVVSISGEESDSIIRAAEVFVGYMKPFIDRGLIAAIEEGVDESQISGSADFIYDHLPMFLAEEDYARIDSLLSEQNIASAVSDDYSLLTSMSGMVVGDFVRRDPLNLYTRLLKKYERFSDGLEYSLYEGHVFSKDLKTLFLFIDPACSMGNTDNNDLLVTGLEKASAAVAALGAKADFIGGPVVAVYNARQIKKDTAITLSIALLIILGVIFFSFRNKWSIPLILLPTLFGALFSLAIMGLIRGSMSAIALGAGTVVLGVSLSYSIHVVSHSNYTNDPHRIIRELTYPLTIGCLTTIGAFVALLFTNSGLLQDLGLFAAFALVGTIIFALVFIPHFAVKMKNAEPGRLLKFVERCNTCSFENKKWLVAVVFLVTVICLFFYGDVKFDDDMNHINYIPQNIVEAEENIGKVLGNNAGKVYLVTSASDLATASAKYDRLNALCDSLMAAGKIRKHTSVGDFVFSPEEQKKSIDRWNAFWLPRKEGTISTIRRNAIKQGFKGNAFAPFENLLDNDFEICRYTPEELENVDVLSDRISVSGSAPILVSSIVIDEADKESVYRQIESLGNTAVVDRAYFSAKMVTSAGEDFNYIIFVSSLIVFVALLISYGRIELTLMTFLPMCISWVIILGIMAIFDIKFNIINIILATFIFGIGDDFSIFIMDGLLQDYKDGRRLLGIHKTAIFFSFFTIIVGMGALMFARHPAIKSIAFISVMGMCVVIFVSYIVQPFLFKLFVSSHARKGNFPYTLCSVLNTAYAFVYFFTGCLIIEICSLILVLLPVKRSRKKLLFHRLIYGFTRFFLHTVIAVKTIMKNPCNEKFDRPAVIIANHQSFIDILLLLATTPKIIMVTNSWVWNSPFFGWIVRYADFCHSANGYEHLAEKLRKRIDEGYSVVVFPEGTRSADCTIRRFHKGAFYLAQSLKLDIVPVVIYGTGQVSSKRQPFHIKRGIALAEIMQRIEYGDTTFGTTYREQSKLYRKWFERQYEAVCDEYDRASNPYFRNALIKNYIYKTPVLEWYMRVKSKMDGYYDQWDRLIPKNATITDVGCGYGQLSFMLGLLSRKRNITGVDYDDKKISLAANAFLKTDNIHFKCADMRICDFPESDVFVFNDSLHYVSADNQEKILDHCMEKLNRGGMIIIKDGDASDKKRHRATVNTEIWSTELLHFNRTDEKLEFVGKDWVRNFAERHNLSLKAERCGKKTSETMYILNSQ